MTQQSPEQPAGGNDLDAMPADAGGGEPPAERSPAEPADALSAPQESPVPPTGDGEAQPPERLVPVSESIRYRRRAQQAERRLAELQQELDEQRGSQAAVEAELASARRRGELTRLLAGRGAIDLDAGVVLAEQWLADPARAESAPADAVEQLLKDKPYLTGRGQSGGEPGSAPQATMTTPTQGRRVSRGPADLLRAAARRAASGRSADLSSYLKLRRRFR